MAHVRTARRCGTASATTHVEPTVSCWTDPEEEESDEPVVPSARGADRREVHPASPRQEVQQPGPEGADRPAVKEEMVQVLGCVTANRTVSGVGARVYLV